MLIIVAAFHVEVAVERVGIAGEQTNLAPAASMAPGTQFFQGSSRDQDKVNLVSDVVRDGIVTVSPHTAHRAGAVVLGRVHQMVDDEAVLALLKKAGEARVEEMQRVAVAQGARPFAEHIVLLYLRTHGELPPESGDTLAFILKRDFYCKQFVAQAAIFGTLTLNGMSGHGNLRGIAASRDSSLCRWPCRSVKSKNVKTVPHKPSWRAQKKRADWNRPAWRDSRLRIRCSTCRPCRRPVHRHRRPRLSSSRRHS